MEVGASTSLWRGPSAGYVASTRFARVSLGVHPENRVALNLYKKFGFHQFATGNGGYLNTVKHFGNKADSCPAPNAGSKV